MIENLQIAAQISLLGMSLVFGAILLLWGVLALLVRLTAEREHHAEITTTELADEEIPHPASPSRTKRAQAAAIAVAAALAIHIPLSTSRSDMPSPQLPPNTISAWQAVTRATALNARRPRR